MIYLAIDPGASGAIAALYDDDHVETIKLSETERDISDWLVERQSEIKFGILEKVHAMPRQGVTSTFKFGTSYGFCRGLLICHEIPWDTVTPAKWQRAMGCLTKGDKNISKSAAQRLHPEIRITHAIADAILIAHYCRRISCCS